MSEPMNPDPIAYGPPGYHHTNAEDTGFFQPGRTYRSRRCADLRFECLALSPDPDSGDQQAIGWRYGPPRDGIRRAELEALGADDWACCDWTDTTDTTTGDTHA